MALNSNHLISHFSSFSRDQISRAGARYTPGIDPDAPNISIESLVTDLNHLVCGPEAQERCNEFAENIEKEWKKSRTSFENIKQMDETVAHLISILREATHRIRNGELGLRDEIVTDLKTIYDAVETEERRLEMLEREATKRARNKATVGAVQSTEAETQASSIRARLYELRRMEKEVSDLEGHFNGSSGALLVNRLCLLSGQWGTGKTHFLCDFAKQRLEQSRPILILLAKSFQGSRPILTTLAEVTGLDGSIVELLDQLDDLGEKSEERVLLVIDGVNEGPRALWRKAIDELTELLSTRKNVALVLSCRSPFEHYALSDTALRQLIKITHRGFEDYEFDAQAEFFHYYGVPLPEVPLLDEEFSRPLTLKLICEAFRGLGTNKLKEGFHGVASGQKGMTYVLETFVNRIAEPIERRHGLPRKACWELLKGRKGISDSHIAGFAAYMAATLREYVGRRTAHRIVRSHFPTLSSSRRSQLLEDMRISGLLDEDYIWTSIAGTPKSIPVFRLPYQRFSDHLIARHLLEKYLDKSSEESLRNSFSLGEPLGRVFRKKCNYDDYARPGWAEAIIVEFPETVKRVARSERELFFFLPKSARDLNYYYKPFVQGLFWRSPESFTHGTDRVVSELLDRGNEWVWCETIDAIVAISIKPGHPYSAKLIYDYLSRYSLADRDMKWTEYVRRHYKSPSIVRLLSWAGRIDRISLPSIIAKQIIVLFSLVLTTVVRLDRDIATRALVELGERHPRLLFEHAIIALDFNDPYVPERMLAACYGVVMSKYAVSRGIRFRNALCKLALSLYKNMFAKHAPFATHHTLRRDYALGIIRFALSIQPDLINHNELENLDIPFSQIPSPFPEPKDIADEQIVEAEGAIHMDFGNYTLGRLIRNRHNYDFKNDEYKKIRRQIEWRIWDLGYRKSKFKIIDREIANKNYYAEQRNASRIDRYGKKYSWIAFFEMYGLREAHGLLSDVRLQERTSDCDIDPSFPKQPPKWSPPCPVLFGDASVSSTSWVASGFTPDYKSVLRVPRINGIKGPWVLLQGFIHRQDQTLDREIFTFLRGLFVRKKDVQTLRGKFMAIEYPGNMEIPDGPSDYYTFAGEAGTSLRFAPELQSKSGRYHRYIVEAFDATVRIPRSAKSQAISHRKKIVLSLSRANSRHTKDNPQPSDREPMEIAFNLPEPSEWQHIPGVRVEIPYRTYSWESHHSAINSFSGFMIPSASIIDRLNLCTWNRECDFRDENGDFVTLYRDEGCESSGGDTHSFLYIKESSLRNYLSKTRQTLVWCAWGERGWVEKGDLSSSPTQEQLEIFRTHAHIHRCFYEYDHIKHII